MAGIYVLSIDRTLTQRIAEAVGDRASVAMVQSLDEAEFDEPGMIVVEYRPPALS